MSQASESDLEQAYVKKALRLSDQGGLRAYLVIIREINDRGEIAIKTVVYSAPSWSHVAAKYDHPEAGVEVLKQEFLAMADVSLMPLASVAMLSELAETPRRL